MILLLQGDQFPVNHATCVAEIELGDIYGLQNSLYHDMDSLLWFMGKFFIIIRQILVAGSFGNQTNYLLYTGRFFWVTKCYCLTLLLATVYKCFLYYPRFKLGCKKKTKNNMYHIKLTITKELCQKILTNTRLLLVL